MSVNLYINEWITEFSFFKPAPHNGSVINLGCGDIKVFTERGRFYSMWDENTPVPEGLKEFVEEVSLYEMFPWMADRETGVYHYKMAEGTVVFVRPFEGHGPRYKVEISAKNLEDAKELLHMIKVGGIRPDESYEGPQCGESRTELKAMIEEVRMLAVQLRDEQWPLCTKKTVASRILDALDVLPRTELGNK